MIRDGADSGDAWETILHSGLTAMGGRADRMACCGASWAFLWLSPQAFYLASQIRDTAQVDRGSWKGVHKKHLI